MGTYKHWMESTEGRAWYEKDDGCHIYWRRWRSDDGAWYCCDDDRYNSSCYKASSMACPCGNARRYRETYWKGNVSCDVCGVPEIPRGSMSSCRECNWDMCLECIKAIRNPKALKVPPVGGWICSKGGTAPA